MVCSTSLKIGVCSILKYSMCTLTLQYHWLAEGLVLIYTCMSPCTSLLFTVGKMPDSISMCKMCMAWLLEILKIITSNTWLAYGFI